MNVFVKPNDQSQTRLCFGMARKLRQRQQFSDRYEKEDARPSKAQTRQVMAIGRRMTREGAAYHSAIRWEHIERRKPIDKQRDDAVEGQEWRAGKEIRNVRLQAVLFDSSMRFDKRKGIKEKKQEEGHVNLLSPQVFPDNVRLSFV